MDPLLAGLAVDLGALRAGGVTPSRASVYRALLELGTIDDVAQRDEALEAVLDAADASGEQHLALLTRLAALPLLPGRQRELVDELCALLERA